MTRVAEAIVCRRHQMRVSTSMGSSQNDTSKTRLPWLRLPSEHKAGLAGAHPSYPKYETALLARQSLMDQSLMDEEISRRFEVS
jgi:hypothetical protein